MEVIEFFTFKFFNKIGRNKTSSTIKEFTIKETIFINITPNQNKVSSIDLEIKYKLLYEIYLRLSKQTADLLPPGGKSSVDIVDMNLKPCKNKTISCFLALIR